MDNNSSGVIVVAGTAVSVLFIWVGLAMAHDAPAAADAAVGKGLLALGAAAAIVVVVVLLDVADRRNAAKYKRPPLFTVGRDED